MSSEKFADMVKLRNAGWTYQEIADKYNISKQCAHQAIKRHVKSERSPKRSSLEKCIFPNIKQWMIENRIKVMQLSRMCNLENNCSRTIQRKLCGVTDFKMSEIKVILDASGKTFEYMFETKETV